MAAYTGCGFTGRSGAPARAPSGQGARPRCLLRAPAVV